MKTIFALLFLLFFTAACASNVEVSAPALVPAEETAADVASDPIAGGDDIMNADCDAPVPAQVMLDAFPSNVGAYVEVGETIADDNDDPDLGKSSTALRTLTINDESYISFSGTDACGFNTNKVNYDFQTPMDNEYGSLRVISVQGREAKMGYDAGTGSYTVYVLLRDRVLIQIHGDSVSEETLLDASEKVDLDSIESRI